MVLECQLLRFGVLSAELVVGLVSNILFILSCRLDDLKWDKAVPG